MLMRVESGGGLCSLSVSSVAAFSLCGGGAFCVLSSAVPASAAAALRSLRSPFAWCRHSERASLKTQKPKKHTKTHKNTPKLSIITLKWFKTKRKSLLDLNHFFCTLLAQGAPSPFGGACPLLATVAVRLQNAPAQTRGGVLLAYFLQMG